MDEKQQDQEPVSEDRKFLHDLASPLSILKILIGKLSRSEEEQGALKFNERQKKMLDNMSKAITTLENLHSDHRAKIHERSERK